MANSIENNVKTIVARFNEMKKDPLTVGEVDGEVVDVNKLETALRSVGIQLRQTNGDFRHFDDVIYDISAKWGEMTNLQQRYIATTAAGSRQQSRFIALVQNNTRLMELNEYATNSAGAAQAQFEKTLDSLESSLNTLKNSVDIFWTNLVDRSAIKFFVDAFRELIDHVNNFLNLFDGGMKTVASLATVTLAFVGVRALLQKALDGLTNMVVSSMRKAGIKAGEESGDKFSKSFKKAINMKDSEDLVVKSLNRIFETIQAMEDAKKTGKEIDEEQLKTLYKQAEILDEVVEKTKDAAEGRRFITQKQIDSTLEQADANDHLTAATGLVETATRNYAAAQTGLTGGIMRAIVATGKWLITMIKTVATQKVSIAAATKEVAVTELKTASTWKLVAAKIAQKIASLDLTTIIIAGLAVAALVIGFIVKEIDQRAKLTKEIEKNEKSMSNLKDQMDEMASKTEQLKKTWQEITSSREDFNNLIKGTIEWKENILKINDAVLKLKDLLPDLQIGRGKFGELTFDENEYEKSLEKLIEKQEKAQPILLGQQLYKQLLDGRMRTAEEIIESNGAIIGNLMVGVLDSDVFSSILLSEGMIEDIKESMRIKDFEKGFSSKFSTSPITEWAASMIDGAEQIEKALSQVAEATINPLSVFEDAEKEIRKWSEDSLYLRYIESGISQYGSVTDLKAAIKKENITREDIENQMIGLKINEKVAEHTKDTYKNLKNLSSKTGYDDIIKLLNADPKNTTLAKLKELLEIDAPDWLKSEDPFDSAIIDAMKESIEVFSELLAVTFNQSLEDFADEKDQILETISNMRFAQEVDLSELKKLGNVFAHILSVSGIEGFESFVGEIEQLTESMSLEDIEKVINLLSKDEGALITSIDDIRKFFPELKSLGVELNLTADEMKDFENRLIEVGQATKMVDFEKFIEDMVSIAQLIAEIRGRDSHEKNYSKEQVDLFEAAGLDKNRFVRNLIDDTFTYIGTNAEIIAALAKKSMEDAGDSYRSAEKTIEDYEGMIKRQNEVEFKFPGEKMFVTTKGTWEVTGLDENRQPIFTWDKDSIDYSDALKEWSKIQSDQPLFFDFDLLTPEEKEKIYQEAREFFLTEEYEKGYKEALKVKEEYTRTQAVIYGQLQDIGTELANTSEAETAKMEGLRQALLAQLGTIPELVDEYEIYSQYVDANGKIIAGNEREARKLETTFSNLLDRFRSAEKLDKLLKNWKELIGLITNINEVSGDTTQELQQLAQALGMGTGPENLAFIAENFELLEDAMEGSADQFMRFFDLLEQYSKELYGIEYTVDVTSGVVDFGELEAGTEDMLNKMLSAFLELGMFEVVNVEADGSIQVPEIISGPDGVPQYTGKTIEVATGGTYSVLKRKDETAVRTQFAKSGLVSKDKGSKASTWENSFDWLYNLVQRTNKELRERNKLEWKYGQILKDNTKNADDLGKNVQHQYASLYAQQELFSTQYTKRLEEAHGLLKGNAKLSKYASFDFDFNMVQIDWERINRVKDTELGGEISKFISSLENVQKELEGIEDNQRSVIDQLQALNDLGKDAALSLEQRIHDALVDVQQKEIDRLERINDSIESGNQRLLSGIREGIEEQRRRRERDKSLQDITQVESRLSLLRADTSGASDLEILRLEKELADKRQNYTDSLIDDTLDELEKGNQKAEEQRREQIELMRGQLEFNQETGKFWEEVKGFMSEMESAGGITGQVRDLLSGAEDFLAMSQLQQEDWLDQLRIESTQAVEWLKRNELKATIKIDGLGQYSNFAYTSSTGSKGEGNYETKPEPPPVVPAFKPTASQITEAFNIFYKDFSLDWLSGGKPSRFATSDARQRIMDDVLYGMSRADAEKAVAVLFEEFYKDSFIADYGAKMFGFDKDIAKNLVFSYDTGHFKNSMFEKLLNYLETRDNDSAAKVTVNIGDIYTTQEYNQVLKDLEDILNKATKMSYNIGG